MVNNDWGYSNANAFTDLLKKHDIPTVMRETIGATDQDMSAQLSKLKASDADTLFVTTEVEQLV